MALFSERYGYVKPREAFIKEEMPIEVRNAICTSLEHLRKGDYNMYIKLEKYVWVYYLNFKESDFPVYRPNVIISYVEDEEFPWYRKLDLVEIALNFTKHKVEEKEIPVYLLKGLVESLNFNFKRLFYGYSIIENKITPITSEQEITAIETAIANNKDNVKEHLHNALNLFAKRPEADYRNSIKESISAVEAYCREQTGKSTLGDALNEMKHSHNNIPQTLKAAFEKLYGYTCSKDTGIRHALMDDSGTYTPQSAEAQFMLVSCSAFLNYLKMKTKK